MNKLLYIFLILILSAGTGCRKAKRSLVISKIRSTAKLASTETIIDKVVVGDKEKRVFGLVKISNAEFVAYSRAIVKTGINLTKIKRKDVVIDGVVIELHLPPVEVLDFDYPFEQFKMDSTLSDNDIINKIDVIDQENFFRKAELDIRKHLKYMGIIEQTQENTQKLMEGLLKNLGYEEIYISFADSSNLIQEVNVGNLK